MEKLLACPEGQIVSLSRGQSQSLAFIQRQVISLYRGPIY